MFYDRYLALCQKAGKKPSAVASDLGINKSNVTNWKNNGYTPRGDVLQKIADYFDVTTDFLLGAESEKAPIQTDGRQVSDEDIKFALFGGDGEITDAMYDEVKRFARMVKLRDEAEKKKG